MAGNGYGNARDTREGDLRAYDNLPPLLRRAMRDAVANWSAGWAAKQLRDGRRLGDREITRRIIMAMSDSEQIDTFKAYGPAHPECRPAHQNLRAPAKAWWRQPKRRAQS